MRIRRDPGNAGRAPRGAPRAFLQLADGNELAAESPSIARRAVAVLLATLFLFSVSLFWAGGVDAGKVLRPGVAAAHDDDDGEDNSGPGNADDDDSATSLARETAGTTLDSISTRATTTSRRGADTRGTTGNGNDSTRATATGTSRRGAGDTSNRTTRGGTTA